MSATQVANMLCDIFGSKSKLRGENLAQCFNEEVVVSTLFTVPAEPLLRGRAALVAALGALPPAKAEAERRVFIEIDSDQPPPHSPTLSLDFYAKHSVPGLNTLLPSKDVADCKSADDYILVLYRVLRDRISEVASTQLIADAFRACADGGSCRWRAASCRST